jgi:hypothetical protein
MAASGDKSSKITLANGKTVNVNTNLDNGQGTLTDSNGKTIGFIGSKGNVYFNGGDSTAQKALVGGGGRNGQLRASIQRNLKNQVKAMAENENKAIINNNASTTQKLNLKDMGYGDSLDIPDPLAPNGGSGDKTGDQEASPSTEEKNTNQQPNQSYSQGKSASGTMRYPVDQPKDLDFVIFKGFEYQPLAAAGGPGGFGSGMLSRMSERLMDATEKFAIILPIQQSVNDTNSVSWGDDNLNFLQAAAAGAITEATKVIGGADGRPGQVIDSFVKTVGNASAQGPIKSFLATKAAQEIIGSDIFGRSTGMAANNNLTLLFKGVSLRGFAFQFTMTPKRVEDSEEIKKIIRAFKQAKAPGVGASGLFLQAPNIFKIEYRNSEGQPHPYLNTFKPLALTDMAISYTPNNQYTTYEDSGMIQYQMNLTFKEIDPIFREDYDDGEGLRGMGF